MCMIVGAGHANGAGANSFATVLRVVQGVTGAVASPYVYVCED